VALKNLVCFWHAERVTNVSSKPGPPPLAPFGLVLHHDGKWSHEGQPILHRGIREHFDRSVTFLPAERKFVVTLRHFRGEIVVEEAGFFVREVDVARGEVALSDRTRDRLDVASLHASPRDGALLCRVKRDLVPEGLLARFMPSAQAELLAAIDPDAEGFSVVIGGRRVRVPELG
jgi:hypothetical protein